MLSITFLMEMELKSNPVTSELHWFQMEPCSPCAARQGGDRTITYRFFNGHDSVWKYDLNVAKVLSGDVITEQSSPTDYRDLHGRCPGGAIKKTNDIIFFIGKLQASREAWTFHILFNPLV